MTTSCSPGDKPTVTYQFGSGGKRVYKSDYAPIEVITKQQPISTTENYNREGYKVTYSSPNNGIYLSVIVKDYYFSYASTYMGHPGMQVLRCGDTAYTGNGNIDISTLTIDRNTKCPTQQQDAQKYTIEIFYNNQRIFVDQGPAPITFDIQCGKCPQGTCECPTPVYPGYCCLDCASTAANIRTITNELKTKNS
ncbi:hypothetical protein [Nostoc sp.]|uniref:hypothetical protein n=1 Tax=Nostoc sp. TaxID=1180 RepID=UPI002FF943F1